jgi:hypothetical protein
VPMRHVVVVVPIVVLAEMEATRDEPRPEMADR